MSVQSPTPESVECDHCGGPRDPYASVEGSYCSRECYWREKGHNALRQIEQDHRFCGSCFRRIKSVQDPPEGTSLFVDPVEHDRADDRVQDVLMGHQYRTEHTDVATDDFNDDRYRESLRTRWSCRCGNVDPQEQHDVLAEVDVLATLLSLRRCLTELAAEGSIGGTPTDDAFIAAIHEHPTDWAYIAGRTLYA